MEALCKGQHSCFTAYLHSVRALRFEDKPDYFHLRTFFREAFTMRGFLDDGVMDWTSPTPTNAANCSSAQNREISKLGGNTSTGIPPSRGNTRLGNNTGNGVVLSPKAGNSNIATVPMEVSSPGGINATAGYNNSNSQLQQRRGILVTTQKGGAPSSTSKAITTTNMERPGVATTSGQGGSTTRVLTTGGVGGSGGGSVQTSGNNINIGERTPTIGSITPHGKIAKPKFAKTSCSSTIGGGMASAPEKPSAGNGSHGCVNNNSNIRLDPHPHPPEKQNFRFHHQFYNHGPRSWLCCSHWAVFSGDWY